MSHCFSERAECDARGGASDSFPLVWLDSTRRDVLRDVATQAHATVYVFNFYTIITYSVRGSASHFLWYLNGMTGKDCINKADTTS